MTKQPIDVMSEARKIWRGLSAADLRIALMTFTTFPMGDSSEVLADLKTAYEKSGGDLLLAVKQADDAHIMNVKHGR